MEEIKGHLYASADNQVKRKILRRGGGICWSTVLE